MNSLDADTLALICQFRPVDDVFRLWASGDKQLRGKLEAKALKELKFAFNSHSLGLPFWPTFATYFPQLESLTITSHVLGRESLYRPRLHELRATNLRRLKLAYFPPFRDYSAALSARSNIFDNLEYLNLKIREALPKPLPPNLTSLTLDSSGSYSFSFDDDSYLPKTLQELRLRLTISSFKATMPPNLTDLEFKALEFNELTCPTLPTSLTVLCLSENFVQDEPKVRFNWPDYSRLTNLTSLRIFESMEGELPENFFASLPNSIQSLELNLSIFHPYLKIDDSTLLPSSLKNFDCRMAKVERAIPTLRTLIADSLPMTPDFFGAMRNLVQLNLHHVPVTAALIALLPRTMHELLLGDLVDEMLPVLPPALRKLVCTSSATVKDESWNLFPKNLTYLGLSSLQIVPKYAFFHALPRNLRELYFYTTSAKYIATQNYADLPTTIEKTHASYTPNTVPARFKSWKKTHLNLVELTVELASLVLDPLYLSSLPMYLRLLNLTGAPLIGNEHLAALPRSLTNVYIGPPSDAVFHESKFDNHGMAQLPRTLRTLRLPKAPLVTSECRKSLPPLLRNLQLGSIQMSWFTPWTEQELLVILRK